MRVASISPQRATTDEQIAALIAELERQSKTRRDYVVPAKDIKAVVDDGEVKFAIQMDSSLPPVLYEPTITAHEGMWNRFNINKTYYERMGNDATDLLATNINYWAERDGRNFLMRTLDDKVRAFMSDRFRTLDSVELFFTAFQESKKVGAKIVQADLTETNFYMKILHPEWATKLDGFKMDMRARRENRQFNGHNTYSILEHLDDEDDGGTYLVPGIVVRNSDVGHGSLNAELFIFDLVCSNGMIGQRTIHQVHLGAQQGEGYVSYETRELEDRAIWGKVRDLITASFDKTKFLAMVKRIQEASQEPLQDATAAVDSVVRNFGFSDEDRQQILNELISAGSSTVYGLLSAVTAVGRDKSNYDEGVRFERAGGDILENPNEFVRVRASSKTKRG